MYFWWFMLILLGASLNSYFSINLCTIVYSRCQKIKKLRDTANKFNLTLTWNIARITIVLLWQAAWLMISQWLNNTVIMIGKNKYEIRFCIGGKIYKAVVKHKLGPSPILQVVDKDDNDITHVVEPYILFNSQQVSPGDLSYDTITIMYSNGTDKQYERSTPLIS